MKLLYKISLLLLILGIFGAKPIQAQGFFNYQTIGANTFFFSVIWQGEPLLGLGYNRRAFGTTFTDIQAEIRFPLKDMYNFDDFEVIAGMSKPVSIDKAFMGTGVHLRLERQEKENKATTALSLALTVLPSYAFLRNLDNKPYGTAGLRITYAPVLYASTREAGSEPVTQALAAHKVELGGHIDLHFERTMAVGLNGFASRKFFPQNSILTQTNTWGGEGDLYLGSNYRLGRN